MYWTCSLFRSARGRALPAVQRRGAGPIPQGAAGMAAGGRAPGRAPSALGGRHRCCRCRSAPGQDGRQRPSLTEEAPPPPRPYITSGEGGRRAGSCDWLTNLPSSPPPARAGTIYLFWLAPRRGCALPANGRPAEGGNGGDAESLCACAVLRRVCLLLPEVRRRRRRLPAFGPAWRPWRPGRARRPPGERPPLGAARPCCGAGRGVSAAGCGRCRPGKWSGTSGTSWPG